jgi:hypothetical protein
MRDLIRKVLKENRHAKFIASFQTMLVSANAKAASMFGVHPDDWYLGTQIEYKWRKKHDPSHCLFYGSPDAKVAERMALFNIWDWNKEESGYRLYCDIINQYYDLDNFEIPNDDKTIYAYLDRVYNLVNLDGYGNPLNIDNYMSNPTEHRSLFGYEYNDYDEEGDIGTHHQELAGELSNVFNINRIKSLELIDSWTMNKVLTDNYRDI